MSNPPKDPGLLQRIGQSILPDSTMLRTDRERKRFLLSNLVLHFRPKTVPESTLRFTLTWALGGTAVTLLLLQLGTGIMLKFAYDPSPGGAYASVDALRREVVFGPLVRNIHYWCANLIVAAAFLHMLRVFYTSAFHAPRQFNWIVGWLLFALLLAANFTGYLLPFDQFAYWAVTVSTGMLAYVPFIGAELQQAVRGGPEIGRNTLRLFFALHTAVLPVVTTGLAAFHFWRIRKAGGLVVPQQGSEGINVQRIASMPHLLVREAAAAMVVSAFVLLLATFFDAPLGDPANAGLSPNPTKAPWYFAAFQEMLLHLHPSAAIFWFPLAGAVFLAAVAYVRYPKNTAGTWFVSPHGKRLTALSASIGFTVTFGAILIKELAFGDRVGPPAFSIVTAAAVPAALAAVYGILRRRSTDTNEALLAIFTLLASAVAALTVVGVFFRGEGMQWAWWVLP
jgi:quinol-cytochrome oxidoreductase complex cytochrome b subunit